MCPLKPNSTPSSLGTHTTFSSLLEMPHAGNDLQAPDKKSYLALKLYQYNLLTGLYMLDPWERYLFSKCTPKVQATTPPQRLGQPWIVLNVQDNPGLCVEMTSFSLDLYCLIYTILSKSSQVPVTSSVGVQMCVYHGDCLTLSLFFSL